MEAPRSVSYKANFRIVHDTIRAILRYLNLHCRALFLLLHSVFILLHLANSWENFWRYGSIRFECNSTASLTVSGEEIAFPKKEKLDVLPCTIAKINSTTIQTKNIHHLQKVGQTLKKLATSQHNSIPSPITIQKMHVKNHGDFDFTRYYILQPDCEKNKLASMFT